MSVIRKIKIIASRYLERRRLKEKNIMIAPYVTFSNVDMEQYVNIAHHAELSDSKIGKRTSIGRYTKVRNAEIGRYCSISWDVTIGAVSHPMKSLSSHASFFRKKFGLCSTDEYLTHKKVIIGNDVWIGCNVVIMPGVHIGDGAVLGGGGIITKDVKPYEVVVGNPAKHLKYRFSDEIIDFMLRLKWWDWDDKDIKNNIELFSPHIEIETHPEILKKLESISRKYSQ